ncbi:MAG TPA: TonB-dependent receptor [Bacteroides sp.]|nr:TonB-dependent receptor [Bacteroides sp.]
MKRNFLYSAPIIFSAIFLLPGSRLSANADEDNPPRGIVTGRVMEEGTNTPMEYTTVAIYSTEDSSLVGGTVSGPEGNFEIRRLPFGEYYVVTNFVGYQKKVIDPVLVTRSNEKVDLGLLEMSVDKQSIEEVEIVADRKHVEYKLDKKIVNVSQDINAAGGTAADVLENTPSVSVDIEGNVTLRGSGSFTVLIDGKPSVLEGSDALQQIPASAIENIEIITNPSAKHDPDGNAGIINVIMKDKTDQGLNGIVNASVGLNNKYRADFLLNRRTGNWNFFLGGNYNNNLYPGRMTREQVTFTDSLDRVLEADGAFDFRRSGLQLKGGVSYDFSETSTLTLEASGGNYGFGIDRSNRSHEYTMPATDDIYYVSRSTMDRSGRYLNFTANYTKQFDSRDHQLTTMAYFSRSTGDGIEKQEDYNTEEGFLVEDVIPFSTRAVETEDEYQARLEIDYTRPVGATGKLEVGYQARLDDEFENRLYEEFDNDTDVWIENEQYTSGLDFFRNIQAAYATYGGEWKNFQYQLGLRGEYTYRKIEHERSGEDFLINRLDYYPTLHLAWQFKNDHQLMLSYSKRVDRPRGYWLEPNISYVDPYTIRVGNPALEPEYIHSLELGYQKGWGMNFLAAELYYRNTTNLITRVTEFNDSLDLFVLNVQNMNNDHSAGAELMVNWKFWKWLTVNGSITPYYYRINGDINGTPVEEETFSWRSNLNTTFQITPTTRLQTNMAYRSRTVTAQGTSEGFYYMNVAFRQDLFDRKLSATLQLRDVFGTMKRDFTNTGENFEQHVVMMREPRVLTLTLSYRINNYRNEPERRGEGGGEMDFGGGF